MNGLGSPKSDKDSKKFAEFRKRVSGYFVIDVPPNEPYPRVRFGQYFRGARDISTALGYDHNVVRETTPGKKDPRLTCVDGYWFVRATATEWGTLSDGLRPYFEKIFGPDPYAAQRARRKAAREAYHGMG